VFAGDATKLDNYNDRLKGDFALISEEHCVYSPAGFGPAPELRPLGPVNMEHTTIEGIVTLDGTGAGKFIGRAASLVTEPVFLPINQVAMHCSVIYSLTADSLFRMERKCEATALRGVGSPGAQTWPHSPVRMRGYLHENTLTLADTELAIETVVSFQGVTKPRLCHRTATATKIAKLK
jgi:hypothetical protein